jgi:hypothetical protein
MKELLRGALDRSRLSTGVAGLKSLLRNRHAPVKAQFLNVDGFPDFIVSSFSLVEDHGNIINVWMVKDREIDTYKVIGGVAAGELDKSRGYQDAYYAAIAAVQSDDELANRAIDVIDHVITSKLSNMRINDVPE